MYQANLQMSSGTEFTQTFTLQEADGTAIDITGYTLYAKMAKHDGAVNVSLSTSTDPVWKVIPFTTSIVDATAGQYSISLAPSVSVKIPEGKYVYSVVTEDASNVKKEVLSGLIFVDKAFADTGDYGSTDPNYP